MSNIARVFVMGIAMTFMPGIAHALALGNLKVYSALNEPFNAEIAFTSLSKKERRTLTVRLGRRADFAAAGIERLAFLSALKITVARRPNGEPFIRLSSEQRIREPFIRFLLEVDWAGGRLIREFTALIDPADQVVDNSSGNEAPESAFGVKTAPPAPREPAAPPLLVTRATVGPTPAPPIDKREPIRPPKLLELEGKSVQQGQSGSEPARAEQARSSKQLIVATPSVAEKPVVRPAIPESTVAIVSAEQKELADRIGAVESELKVLQRLIALKKEAAATTQEPTTQSQSRETGTEPQETAAIFDATTSPQGSAEQRPPVVAAPTKPKPKPQMVKKPPRPVAPPPRRAEWDAWEAAMEIIRERTRQALMAVVALVVGLIFFGYARRRRPQTERGNDVRFPEDAMAASGEQAATGAADDTFFLSDFTQDRMGNISVDEIDAVDETEAYTVWGRDEDAVEALKDAIAKHPEQHDLKFKLLTLYHHRKEMAAYEALTEELRAAMETAESAEDEEIDDLPDTHEAAGHDIVAFDVDEPNHKNDVAETELLVPGADALAGREKANGPVIEMVETAGERKVTEREMGVLEIDPPIDEQAGAAYGIETSEIDEPANEKKATEQGMEGVEIVVPDEERAIERAIAALEVTTKALEMTMPTGKEVAVDQEAGTVEAKGSSDNEDIDESGTDNVVTNHAMEMPQSDAVTQQKWGNPSTKIGLAKAYIERGDAERARSIVDEVLVSIGCATAPVTSSKTEAQTEHPHQRWDQPVTKLDLAKAYIEMGDGKQACHLLDEVLESWHRGDGTHG